MHKNNKYTKASTKRQMLDKAVQDIHTDKKQVQDVIKKIPEEYQDDLLKELRRRGGDPYPERGLDNPGREEMKDPSKGNPFDHSSMSRSDRRGSNLKAATKKWKK